MRRQLRRSLPWVQVCALAIAAACGAAGVDDPDEECLGLSDCSLLNDCCYCGAYPSGEEPDDCDAASCLVDTCTAIGVGTEPEMSCRGGDCILVDLVCYEAVNCEADAPDCGDAQVPTVKDGCWTGECIPEIHCSDQP